MFSAATCSTAASSSYAPPPADPEQVAEHKRRGLRSGANMVFDPEVCPDAVFEKPHLFDYHDRGLTGLQKTERHPVSGLPLGSFHCIPCSANFGPGTRKTDIQEHLLSSQHKKYAGFADSDITILAKYRKAWEQRPVYKAKFARK